jgi:chitodextrinase
MKKNSLILYWSNSKTLATCLMFASFSLFAQIDKALYSVSVLKNFNNANKRGSSSIQLPLGKGDLTNVQVNFSETNNLTKTVVGSIDGKLGNSFSLKFNNGNVTGQAVLLDQNKAFKYITENGETFVQEVDINEILCVSFDKDKSTLRRSQEVVASASSAAYSLESKPGAKGCVYIDFDGEYVAGTYWNSGNPINAAASGFSDSKITEVWEIASVDFRPFDINITTNVDVFNSYPKNRRMQAVVTPTTTAAPGSGGVAYIGSFNWNDDTPCWVFNLSTKACGETVSHEIGHTFDVLHDGTSSVTYYSGQGDWAPIMGASFYDPITHWSIGDYTDANRFEDDVALISGTKFGIGYRPDVHGNSTATATALQVNADGSVNTSNNNGIIETRVDLDFFSFTTAGGNVTLNFETVSRHGNLDILAKLYNASGVAIGTYNPAGLNATLVENLAAGTYYVSVDGTGNGSPLLTGYSDYGSIGSFFISGTVPKGGVTNIAPTVAITAPVNGTDFTTPASINITASANDVDGTVSKVEFFVDGSKVGESTSSPYAYTYAQTAVGTYDLTAIATDNNGATATSAVIAVTVASDGGNTCTAPIWSATSSYSGSFQVAYNNVVYEAKWWTLNNQPDLFSKPYDVWKVIGPCQGGVNINPTVTLTNPTDGSTFTSGDVVALSATAADTDGTITDVTFYVNGTLIGTDTSAPYSINWTSAVGSANITAIATDNDAATTTSATANITVNDPVENQLPTVTLTNPTDGSTFTTGDVVALSATAADADGTVSKVDFFINSTLIGTDVNAPYSVNWTSNAGSFPVVAIATDNDGGVTTSIVANITVVDPIVNQLPAVAITNPTNGSTFTTGDVVALSATAADADGTISKVEFYIGATLIGTDLSAPYTANWTSTVGSFAVTAAATDNEGGVTTSVVSNITVNDPLVNQLPTVSLTNPIDGAVITQGDVFGLSADANDVDGTIDYVEFFINGTYIGGDITAPYSINFSADYLGSYDVFAIATDNEGGVTTSEYAAISVIEPSTCTTPEWSATTAYLGGDQAAFNGTLYQAKWWTIDNQPDLFSGPYDMWSVIGVCGISEAAPTSSRSFINDNFSTSVYPNPSNGVVTLNITLNEKANVTVNISDINGAAVNTFNFTQGAKGYQTIDLSDLTNGIYFINTIVNGKTSIQKVVITH